MTCPRACTTACRRPPTWWCRRITSRTTPTSRSALIQTETEPRDDRACDHPSAQSPAGLDRGTPADPVVHGVAYHGLLRPEELQRDVLLRLAGAAGAGEPDRHRHLPDDVLHADRRWRIRFRRIHHARRGVGLA